MLWNVGSQMEKDENLQEMIRIDSTYAWKLKMTWDVKNWTWNSIKMNLTQGKKK